jgi:DNA modification methylase
MTKKQAADLKMSLSRLNLMSIPVIDLDDRIVSGHMRCRTLAALGRGNEEVDVRVPNRKLTDDEFAEANLRENKNLGEWDEGLLATFDDSMLKEIGFDDSDLEDIFGLNRGGTEGLTDPDEAPPVPVEAVTQLGDLVVLGNHRLLCGDSTSSPDVERLMSGLLADMVFTDPPYGVNYDGGHATDKRREKLKGDESEALYSPACHMAFDHTKTGAAFYLWHAGVKGFQAAAAAAAAGWEIRSELIWNKNMAQFGAIGAQYKQKHEPFYYCFKKGKAPQWYGANNEVTVWDVSRSSKNEFHPTQKPVELGTKAMVNSSKEGDIVLDLFLGSGSTLIAAEMTGRVCYGLEIDPKYCDVIVQRWENFTGKKAERPVAVAV